jgi:hypothetical protein
MKGGFSITNICINKAKANKDFFQFIPTAKCRNKKDMLRILLYKHCINKANATRVFFIISRTKAGGNPESV